MRSALVVLSILLCAAPARAGDSDDDSQPAEPSQPDQTDAAKQHYQAGLQAYNAAHYDVALAELRKAYQLKPLPLLLINIAATYRKMDQPEVALQFYKKFLEVAPDDARERAEVTAAVAELERQPSTNAPPAAAALGHTVIETAPPDAPVDVRVSNAVGVKLYLYYRQSGVAEFTRVTMKARGDERVGRIPAAALAGVAMEYFIEARDGDGRVVAASGSEDKPNVVLVDTGAASQTLAPVGGSVDIDNETPPIIPASGRRAELPSGRLGPVFWTGLAFSVVGAAGLALGISGDILAQQRASSLTKDAQHSPSFQFNDPNAPGCPSHCMDDASFQRDGLMWNTVGLAGTIAGGVILATGVTMMIVGAARRHSVAKEKHTVRRSAFSF